MTETSEIDKKTPILGGSGMALLCVSAFAAGWYLFGHNLLISFQLPGVGLTITQWALLAAVLICARAKGTLSIKGKPSGVLLLVLAVLMGGSYGLFANDVLRMLNLPVTVFLSSQAVFALTGQSSHEPLSGQGLWEGFRRFFISLFSHWSAPFHALARQKQLNGSKAYALLIGLLLAIPVVAVAVALLSSADSVFGGAVQEKLRALAHLDGSFILKLFFLFPLSLTLFSHLFGALLPERKLSEARRGNPPPMVFAVILAVLSTVYGLFAYVQVRYLFLGAESARMAGGYAEYARSGFFQLVFLSFLTLALLLPALTLCSGSRPVRVLCAVTALLTGVIDFSAFFRMRLYIHAYGLSLLRVLTLWAMAMIALILALTLVKCVWTAFRVCPAAAGAVLCAWVMLNYCNPDRIVAENQVARYNAGEAAWDALQSLREQYSPDFFPALEKIEDPSDRQRARAMFLHTARGEDGFIAQPPGFYEWSLAQLWVPEEVH